jgi:hypothetical protein
MLGRLVLVSEQSFDCMLFPVFCASWLARAIFTYSWCPCRLGRRAKEYLQSFRGRECCDQPRVYAWSPRIFELEIGNNSMKLKLPASLRFSSYTYIQTCCASFFACTCRVFMTLSPWSLHYDAEPAILAFFFFMRFFWLLESITSV